MALTAIILSKVSWDGFAKGTIMITVFGGIIIGLMAATKLVGKNADKIGKTIIMIAGAIGILALIAVLLGLVPIDKLTQGIIAVGILSAIMALLIYVTSLVKKDVMKTLLSLAAVIAVLGGILITLSCLNPASVIVSAIALSALLVVLANVMKQLSPIGSKQKTALKGVVALLALSGVVAVLGLILAMMSALKITNAIPNVIALSILCIALTAVLNPLATVGKHASQAIKGVVALAAMAVPLALFGLVLAMISALQITNAIPNVIALSILCAALTLVLIPLATVGKHATQALIGIVALTAMAVPLAAFALVLALMTALKVTDALPNVIALSVLCAALTLVLIPLALIGTFVAQALLGVLALTAMAVPMVAFVGIIALMSGIENGIANALVLATLMQVLGDVLFKLSIVAPLALVAVAAITALVGVMTAFGVLAGAIGALVTAFPQLQQFLDTGIPIMVQLASGLGQMIGAFISAIAGEVMAVLPQLGLCLSQFMTNAMPFIVGAKLVDETVLAGVAILAGAVLAFVAADLIAGVASFLQCGSSFADLGTQLSQFMTNALPFIMGAAMITPQMMAGVKTLAEVILMLTAANILDGIASFITGGSSLETFAAQLPILGKGLAEFSEELGEFTEDQLETVNCAANAVKTLASAAATIPNTGGLIADLVGNNDLGPFAKQFPTLGKGVRGFLDSIGEFSDPEIDTVKCGAEAVKIFAEASKKIPNTGGWIANLVGDNRLDNFANQFPVLGSGISGFLDSIGTFEQPQIDTVDCAASAVKKLAEVAKSIPGAGGWIEQLVGNHDLGTFASQFPKVGEGLKGFVDGIGTFSKTQVDTVNSAGTALKTITDFSGSSFNTENIDNFGECVDNLAHDIKLFVKNMPDNKTVTDAKDRLSAFVKAIQSVADTDTSGIKNLAKQLKAVGTDAVSKFVESFSGWTTKAKVKSAGATLGDGVIEGLKSKHKATKGAGETATKKAEEGVKAQKSGMETAGKDLGAGLVKGIDAKQDAVYQAGYRLGQKAVEGEKDGQQSKSPSKLTIQAGKWLGEGLVIGMGKMGNQVYESGRSLGQTATSSLSNSISRISEMIDSDIDSQPTIRPVLDLSDVRSGASTIGNMLNMDSSVGVKANVGAISTMMSNRQNGANSDDIVAGIKALRKDLANMPREEYNINGITYSGDSEVNDAIRTLVRAARIEGRT